MNESDEMRLLKLFGKIFGILLFLFMLGHFGLYVYCLSTPKIEITRNQSYYLYDNDGELIFNNYSWVSLDDISDNLIQATLSTEDRHFYSHMGFDYIRIVKAIISNITSRSLSEGASTITQQYARNLYLNYDKTWERKIEEALLAFELETHYSKEEILEGYLNTINYGGVFGIENASQYYFNKSAGELTLAEASMLAGIPQSPSNYSPLYNLDLAKKRQKTVLTLMYNNEEINEDEMNEALCVELSYIGNKNDNITSGRLYFKDAVLNELSTISSIPESILETGGIKIYTTMDSDAQINLEKSIDSKEFKELQVASVMMDPDNGEVLALVGGTDYNTSQFNRAISAKRQVGSTMKPFLYYTALESGFTSASSFISEKTTFSFSSNKKYTPKNYNDKYANGPLSMGSAIAYSDNIYAVKTHLFLGEDNLVTIANRVGISENLEAVPSLALGTEEISLVDMVTGYASFANMGFKVNSHLIRKIEDSNGNILYEYKDDKVNILNENLVFILNEMLTYTYDKDFIDYNYPTLIGLLPKLTNRYAIKSGTTDTDMWIMGYNQDAVLGIWTGYDDNRATKSGDSSFHKDIWVETMEGYFNDKETSWYDIPDNIVGVLVNPLTGEISGSGDKKKKLFYFLKGTEPHKDIGYDFESVFREEDESSDNKKNNENENDRDSNDNNSSGNSNVDLNNNENNSDNIEIDDGGISEDMENTDSNTNSDDDNQNGNNDSNENQIDDTNSNNEDDENINIDENNDGTINNDNDNNNDYNVGNDNLNSGNGNSDLNSDSGNNNEINDDNRDNSNIDSSGNLGNQGNVGLNGVLDSNRVNGNLSNNNDVIIGSESINSDNSSSNLGGVLDRNNYSSENIDVLRDNR